MTSKEEEIRNMGGVRSDGEVGVIIGVISGGNTVTNKKAIGGVIKEGGKVKNREVSGVRDVIQVDKVRVISNGVRDHQKSENGSEGLFSSFVKNISQELKSKVPKIILMG